MKYNNTVSRLTADENGNFQLQVYHITPAIRHKIQNTQKLQRHEVWGEYKNWSVEF
jgi:hypothetical protein